MSDALLVIDIQNDFCKGGSLAVQGAELALGLANFTIEDFAGSPIIYSKDWHPNNTPHFETWPVHCVQNTPGAEFNPNLYVVEDAYIVYKGLGTDDGYSAFSQPSLVTAPGEESQPVADDLESFLQEQHITDLHIVGLATDFCVKQTAIDARKLGYRVTVHLEACAPVYPEKLKETLQEMLDYGVELSLHFLSIDKEFLDRYL